MVKIIQAVYQVKVGATPGFPASNMKSHIVKPITMIFSIMVFKKEVFDE